ncbi:MAG: NfeD family protein [Stenomitos frigidus ULC029]
MLAFNPIKAFNTFWFNEPTGQIPTPFLSEADLTYRGRAIVSAMIASHKRGRVKFQGSWWLAQCEQDVTIAVGEVVQVIGRRNITLLVKPTSLSATSYLSKV